LYPWSLNSITGNAIIYTFWQIKISRLSCFSGALENQLSNYVITSKQSKWIPSNSKNVDKSVSDLIRIDNSSECSI
jgi:hypothetical protein